MKRVVIIALMLAAISGTTAVNAQSWLRGLGRAAENAAKRTVERNVERATERAIDRAFSETEDAVEDAVTGESSNKGKKNKNKNKNNDNNNADAQGYDNGDTQGYDNGDATAQSGQQKPQSVEMAYAKSDFVAGDEIIFEDLLTGEQLGEFPSQWDLIKGTVEVARLNDDKVILCVSQDDPVIAPLFDEMKSYLPEKFTLEFDFWVGAFEKQGDNRPSNRYIIRFYKSNTSHRTQVIDMDDWYYDASDHRSRLSWEFESLSEEWRHGKDESFRTIPNSWNHFALSFNQRAMKVYINGVRYANIPNTIAPGYFQIQFYRSGGYFTNNTSIKNIRIAKGAVPLYDRMMSEGKFITYGITFDVGKATIKPESMGEINRIVQLMTENPDLKFSVEGHTDSTGNAASNQTLSEQRSQAIVAKLVELGIAQDRLTAVGKGQNSPIADNSTDEGRAKNRRVEFVKM